MHRHTTIQVIEGAEETRLSVACDEPVAFTFAVQPKKFEDPNAANLAKIVENQRTEITDALHKLHETEADLRQAEAALAQATKRAKRPAPKPNRRRR